MSKKSNADGERIPIPTDLNVRFLDEMTKGSLHNKIIKYLRFGWPLGHDGKSIPKEAKSNHRGVLNFHQETYEYLQKEKDKGRIFGPHLEKQFMGKNGISPLNSVPRKNDSKRRFVLDLSFPKGKSINDGIDKNFYEGEEVQLKYPTVDDLVELIIKKKKQFPQEKVLLWKRDLKSCYRQFKLCPGSVHLVGYKFEEKYWYDLVLAMGSTSSAQICQKITNLIRFVFENRYDDEVRNFLDDFFSAQIETLAQQSYLNMKDVLGQAGIEENPEKACAPATSMIVLGILFDTETMTLRLTQEKSDELVEELLKWPGRTSCTLRQMQSLIGKLNFASGVVRSGRVYMARLINALRIKGKNSQSTLTLSTDNLNDVRWWIEQIKLRKGVPMISKMVSRAWLAPGSVWSSDSSLTGLGGWSQKTGMFFHYKLEEPWTELDINSLECLSLMLCFHKWAEQCTNKRVLINCDNQTTVNVINSGAAKNRFLQACLREIYHICAMQNAEIRVVWVKTTENSIADCLSRWDQHPKYEQAFRKSTKDMRIQETIISPEDLKFTYTDV